MDFLSHLPEHILEDTIIASFDVESLYSNIPHDLGLDAIKSTQKIFIDALQIISSSIV